MSCREVIAVPTGVGEKSARTTRWKDCSNGNGGEKEKIIMVFLMMIALIIELIIIGIKYNIV